jgi:hypothetical protein
VCLLSSSVNGLLSYFCVLYPLIVFTGNGHVECSDGIGTFPRKDAILYRGPRTGLLDNRTRYHGAYSLSTKALFMEIPADCTNMLFLIQFGSILVRMKCIFITMNII